MNKNDDILDQLLNSSLAGLEGDVSPDAWETISGRLDQLEKKRRPVHWWLAGLLVIGLGIGLIALRVNRQSSVQTSNKTINREEVVREIPTAPKTVLPSQEEVAKSGEETFNRLEDTNSPKYVQKQPNTTEFESKTLDYILPDFNQIMLKIRESNSLSNKYMANPELSIFVASEMGANDFYKIPTISKGLWKGLLTPMNEGSWEYGLSASPALASRLINSNNAFSGLLNHKYNDATKDAENAGMSYQVGLSARRYINKNVYLSSGIQYDQIGESVDYNYTIKDFPIVNYSENRIDAYQPLAPTLWQNVQFNGHNRYHFIEIPLKIGIVVPVFGQKLKVKTEGGLQYMLLTGTAGKKVDPTYLDLISLNSSMGYSRSNLGGMISTGIFCDAGKNLEWGFAPYYQTTFTSIRSKNSPINDKPFSYGLNIQLTYKLLNKTQ